MRALRCVMFAVAGLACAGMATAQEASREARRNHDRLVATYAEAEVALLHGLREATLGGEVAPELQARLEQLARSRDIALRRAQESALVHGLPMPTRSQVLERATGTMEPARLFPRAEELVQAARRADARRLVVTVGLPKEI